MISALFKRARGALAAMLLLALPLDAALAAGSWQYTTSQTRPANTTTYTLNTLVCASPCAALVAGTGTPGGGQIATVSLEKSSSGLTGATFKIWFFRAPPTMTGLGDDVAYPAPFNADAANYLGSATCSTGIVGADNATYYDCALSQTLLPYAASNEVLYELIETTGAYVPTSGEVFKTTITGFYDGQ